MPRNPSSSFASSLCALLGGLSALGTGCRWRPHNEMRPIIRLVAERYQKGDVSMAEVPSAMVAGVRRPVLGDVAGAPQASTSYETAPLTLPPGARLRFAVGLDESVHEPGASAVTFTLTVVHDGEQHVDFETRLVPDDEEPRWLDHEVGLAAYAARPVRLRFETTVEPDRAGVRSSFPVWGDPTVVVPAGSGPRRWNVLLVSLDTLRADHLGCYGYPRPTSPTIDTVLAGRGTIFESAYTAFPSTAEAHMTLLTSLYPCSHGVSLQRALRADAPTLAELLRAGGYETAAFTEDAFLTAGLGFARGFGTYVEDRSGKLQFLDRLGVGAKTLRVALAWIRGHGDAPWFTFVHTYQVHHPYRSPPGYVEEVAWGHGEDRAAADAALYDAAIRYTDDLLAGFFTGLESAGQADRTLVVLVADHGEQLGEGGLFRHGNSLSDVLLHVPLIVRAPGLVPSGRRIGVPVGLIDVVPTVLELVGLPPSPQAQGVSLVPLLSGGRLVERALYAGPLDGSVAVRAGGAKWIVDERTGLGRAAEDADGKPAGALGPPASPTTLLARYESVCTAPPASGPAQEIEPEVREKLRALGYIQ